MLKVLARLPISEDTWLGWGHTVDNGESFDESTQMCGCMLINPANFEETANICSMPDGSEVNFIRQFLYTMKRWRTRWTMMQKHF